jgi:hypothetical protein
LYRQIRSNFGVGVRPEELPTYILASRGSNQLRKFPVMVPAASDAGQYSHYRACELPLPHREYSFNLVILVVLFPFIFACFLFLCCLLEANFYFQSKSFRCHYESFAFCPISRPYPSHTCLVLHIWARAHQPYALRRSPPHDTKASYESTLRNQG